MDAKRRIWGTFGGKTRNYHLAGENAKYGKKAGRAFLWSLRWNVMEEVSNMSD